MDATLPVGPHHLADRQLVCQLQRLAGDVLLVLRWAGLQAATALPREEEHLFQDNRGKAVFVGLYGGPAEGLAHGIVTSAG